MGIIVVEWRGDEREGRGARRGMRACWHSEGARAAGGGGATWVGEVQWEVQGHGGLDRGRGRGWH